jgi:DNA-binding transcriptional MerR regulator
MHGHEGETLASMIDTPTNPPMPPADADTPSPLDGLQGIQDVARQLGVTHRTLRFYEDKGLIEPARVGNTRIYSHRDVARMQLILRGKRLGFTIREIKEFLDLYDVDPTQVEQLHHLVAHIRSRLRKLESQHSALLKTMTELQAMEGEALTRIGELTGRPSGTPSFSVD